MERENDTSKCISHSSTISIVLRLEYYIPEARERNEETNYSNNVHAERKISVGLKLKRC